MTAQNNLEFCGTVVEKWTKIQINKNAWRVSNSFDFDDLLQDAFLIFSKVKVNYKYVDNDKWLFSLYKTAFYNYLTDLANGATRKQSIEVAEIHEDENEGVIDEGVSAECSEILQRIARDAPSSVREVLHVMLTCPDEVHNVAAFAVRKRKPFLLQYATGLSLGAVLEAIHFFKSTVISRGI